MKTRILVTLVLAVALTSTSFANLKKKPVAVNQRADVQLTHDNQIVVRYLADSPDKVKFMVFDENGNTLSKKRFINRGHSKVVYDLNKLNAKKLRFQIIANDSNLLTEKVSIDENGMAAIPVKE